jgi:hypothetical protein
MGFGPPGEPLRILDRARESCPNVSFLVVSQRHPIEALRFIAERDFLVEALFRRASVR